MPNSVYDLAIAPMLHSLKAFDKLISKAEGHAAADAGIADETLIQARLYPNMLPLVSQVRIATDIAKGAANRLSGQAVPSWADEEKTFAELHERIGKTITLLASVKPEDFTGAEALEIELKIGPEKVKFTGTSYIASFVLPNFYFHMTTAYNILRHNGVVLGKRDFLGA